MKRTTKVALASAIGLAAAATIAGGVDQGSLARTWMPKVRPRRSLAGGFDGDVAFLREAVKRHEMGATRAQKLAFHAVLDERQVGTIDELTLAVSEALNCFHNTGTTLITTSAHRVGLRFGWVADALVVVKARPELANLLGHRVVRIAGGDPTDIWPLFDRFIGGGAETWVRNRSAWFFSVPEALRQAGCNVTGGVRLETVSLDGEEQVTLLQAEATPMPGGPLVDFRDRFPGDTGLGTDGWVSALAVTDELPLYLRDPEELLKATEIPWRGRSALYVRLLGAADGGDPDPKQVEAVIEQVGAAEAGLFVVDVRYHSGGDYRVVLPLVRAISERARTLSVPIRLLVGPNTIGGGLVAASQFLVHAGERTLLVGREVGEGLRERGQGRTLALPHSGLLVQLCHDWHDVSADPMPWHDVWLPDKFLLYGVGQDFTPQLGVQNSWMDYLAGRDRVLETALDWQ